MTFAADLALRANTGHWWIEIAGWSQAYGTFAATSSFFSSRAVADRFASVSPYIAKVNGEFRPPDLDETRLDMLAGRSSFGGFRFSLADIAGDLTTLTASRRTDKQLRLATTIDHNDTSVVSLDTPTGYTAASTLYVHRETMVASALSGNTFTVARGSYKSGGVEHLGANETSRSGAKLNGSIITDYPRSLKDRWCYLYWTFDTTDATQAQILCSGPIKAWKWSGSRTLDIEVEDIQGAMKRRLFDPAFDDWDLSSGNGALYTDRRNTTTGATQGVWEFHDGACYYGSASVVHFLRGGRVFAASTASPVSLNSHPLRLDAVGVLLEGVRYNVSHRLLPTRPVVYIGPDNADAATDGSPFASAHPLEIMVDILTSTDAEGPLPPGWGLGIPAALIDATGITRLAELTAGYGYQGILDEPVEDAREFITEELLKPFGFSMIAKSDGTLSVRQIRVLTPTEAANATALTISDLALDGSGNFVEPEIYLDADRVVGAVTYEDTLTLDETDVLNLGPPVKLQIAEDLDTAATFMETKNVEIKCRGITRRVGILIGGGIDGNAKMRANQIQDDVSTAIFARYRQPPQIIKLKVSIALFTLSVGDLVKVTLANVPSAFSTTRGLTDVVCMIVARRVNLAEYTIDLELEQYLESVTTSAARFLAPALNVASWVDGTKTATVTENAYSPGGANDDTAAFAVNDVVRVYSADRASRSIATTIVSKTATTVALADNAAALGVTPASGYFIMHGDYTDASQLAATLAKYAFCAGSDQYLATTTAPHRWGS